VLASAFEASAVAMKASDANGLVSHLPRCELRRSATSKPATAIAQINIEMPAATVPPTPVAAGES
jgi:hypothetical protein